MTLLIPQISAEGLGATNTLNIFTRQNEELFHGIEHKMWDICKLEGNFKPMCSSHPLFIKKAENNNLYLGYFRDRQNNVKFGFYFADIGEYDKQKDINNSMRYFQDYNGFTSDYFSTGNSMSKYDDNKKSLGIRMGSCGIDNAALLEGLVQSSINRWLLVNKFGKELVSNLVAGSGGNTNARKQDYLGG